MQFVFVKKIGGENSESFKVPVDPTDTICDLLGKVFLNEARQKHPSRFGFDPVNIYEEDSIDSGPLRITLPLLENGELVWTFLFFSEKLELENDQQAGLKIAATSVIGTKEEKTSPHLTTPGQKNEVKRSYAQAVSESARKLHRGGPNSDTSSGNLPNGLKYHKYIDDLREDGWKIIGDKVLDNIDNSLARSFHPFAGDYSVKRAVADFAFPNVKGTDEAVQKALNPAFTELGAIITYKAYKKRPVYSATRPEDNVYFQSSTAKPDITAGNGRAVTVELKKTSTRNACYEVVQQCLERVTGFFQANHLLMKAVSIGVTPKEAFLVVATVDSRPEGKDQVTITIHEIDPKHVYRFYYYFAEEESESKHFSVHARAILQAISQVLGDEYKYLFHYFGVKLLSKSSSFVYRVTIPVFIKSFDFVLNRNCSSFVVKVNGEKTRFDKEVNIFKRLAGTEQCYAVATGWVEKGTCYSEDIPEHGHESWVATLRRSADILLQKGTKSESIDENQKTTARTTRTTKANQKITVVETKLQLPTLPWSSFGCGFIVMIEGIIDSPDLGPVRESMFAGTWDRNLQVARALDDLQELHSQMGRLSVNTTTINRSSRSKKKKIPLMLQDTYEEDDHARMTYLKMAGVAKSLQIMHERNVCHGDIRPANVLYFEHLRRFALIDYDLAVDLGERKSDGKSPEKGEHEFPAVEDTFVQTYEESDRFRYCKPLQSVMGFTFNPDSDYTVQAKWSEINDWMMFAVYGVERTRRGQEMPR